MKRKNNDTEIESFNKARKRRDAEVQLSLCDLPVELLLDVYNKLELYDRCSLGQTCSSLRKFHNGASFYKTFSRGELFSLALKEMSIDCKFRSVYRARRSDADHFQTSQLIFKQDNTPERRAWIQRFNARALEGDQVDRTAKYFCTPGLVIIETFSHVIIIYTSRLGDPCNYSGSLYWAAIKFRVFVYSKATGQTKVRKFDQIINKIIDQCPILPEDYNHGSSRILGKTLFDYTQHFAAPNEENVMYDGGEAVHGFDMLVADILPDIWEEFVEVKNVIRRSGSE